MELKAGYKWSELGPIPLDWTERPLQAVVDPQAPIAYGVLKPGEYVHSGVPLLQIRDVIHGEVEIDALHRIGPDLDRQYSRTRLAGDEIVISLVGTIGRVAVVPPSLAAGNIHRNLGRVRIARCHDTKFFYYFLTSPIGQNSIKLATFGSTQALLNLANLRALPTAVPCLAEQRVIGAALSDVEDLANCLDKLTTKKRDLMQAVRQQLLTGQTRLPGFSSPWARQKISDLCEHVGGTRTNGGELGYVEIGDIDVQSNSYDVSQKEKPSVPGAVRVPAGTLLVSKVRPTRGAITVAQSLVLVSSAFCRLRPANDFAFHVVRQPSFLGHLGAHSIGGTYPTCRDEVILGYEAELPSDPQEQSTIAKVLSDMDAELAALEKRRAKTLALKQGMMVELLSGRTRLVKSEAAHA